MSIFVSSNNIWPFKSKAKISTQARTTNEREQWYQWQPPHTLIAHSAQDQSKFISSRCTVDRQHMHAHMHAHMHNYLRNFQSLNGNLSIVHVSSHLLTSCYCPFNLFRLQCNNDPISCTWYEFKRRKATILVPFLMTEGERERQK